MIVMVHDYITYSQSGGKKKKDLMAKIISQNEIIH
jgi:hypothetical protein